MRGRLTFICVLEANFCPELCPERTTLAAAVFYPKMDRAVVSLLSKADWSWSYVSTVDSRGRTIFVADAHCDDGKRFVARSEEKLTAFLEL
jgi:hypothetical protein